ncbi:MAG TPA: SET domain-containing protein-lysine N-methyltransferase [Verrucomicrobiales bacterium]|nr:SET domain-containing protein-lysine N-methyltransferase [Verrucomicrobiales bacterium]
MSKNNKLRREAKLVRKFKKFYERASSDFCEVRGSEIHGRGVYAIKNIAKETEIIEYVGEPINKDTSEGRAWEQYALHEENGDAAVYIFTLDEQWDIDGNVPWNTARLINHSCDPNCEAWVIGRKIYIYSIRKIKKGEELSFDYGFDIESYEDHPCRCGSANCIGYIVTQDQWPELRNRIANKVGEPQNA